MEDIMSDHLKESSSSEKLFSSGVNLSRYMEPNSVLMSLKS